MYPTDIAKEDAMKAETPIPLSRDGLRSAFVAFDYIGSDEENQRVILKLMAAIEAYLRVATNGDIGKLAEAIDSFKAMGFSEDQAKEFMDEKLREIAPKGSG